MYFPLPVSLPRKQNQVKQLAAENRWKTFYGCLEIATAHAK